MNSLINPQHESLNTTLNNENGTVEAINENRPIVKRGKPRKTGKKAKDKPQPQQECKQQQNVPPLNTKNSVVVSWRDYVISANKVYEDSLPLLTINGATFINYSALVTIAGKPKVGKSFFAQSVAIAILKGEYLNMKYEPMDIAPSVLIVDTEQGNKRTQLMKQRINKALYLKEKEETPNLTMLSVRTLSPQERLDAICSAIKELRPAVTIIDGVRDCVLDFNDIRESMNVVNSLMQLATEYHTAIMNLIHTNKGDGNIRGHLGSELTNKSETVIELEKKKGVINVLPMMCRDKEFSPFAMKIADDGSTELCEYIKTKTQDDSDTLKRLIETIFADIDIIEKKQLIAKIVKLNGLSEKTASRRITDAIEQGLITELIKGKYKII